MLTRTVALLLASAALAGCTSDRFGDFASGPMPRSGSQRIDGSFGSQQPMAPSPQRRPLAADEDVIAGGQQAPDQSVAAEDIPPPPGSGRTSDVGPSAIDPALRPANPSEQPRIMVEEPPPRGAAAPPVVAALPRQEAPRPAAQSATAIAGTWTVSDAGDRCRITLTSTPLFEFYRANPQNCRAPSLARINAWEQRGSEVVLLQPGGRVAARLFPQGSGGYSGATATGATVTMAR
ncbi:AprI/Inh family metalloprotease inhibitor [Phreatobacter stygius]|nr:AprI/Inh family metalloprotease inhibitor [Phreatobacter stygius]